MELFPLVLLTRGPKDVGSPALRAEYEGRRPPAMSLGRGRHSEEDEAGADEQANHLSDRRIKCDCLWFSDARLYSASILTHATYGGKGGC